ncbi:putative modification methylase [Bacillus phage vB_BhaS-171]|uniref:DNA methyltransferase n=1 Tax=Bacillus phage vB_BhaS-171 TaxID=1775140 RepID=UPI000744938B|nr:DNA methyltransferase [Bacillus phage vB_BhaS-171]ALY08116.1 putative modification methylase [Bacillus phage vB_BhaS-171]
MEQAGHECVGYVEWDKYARKSYEAIHNTKGEWTWNDVSTIDYRDIPKSDTWTFGFPCQDISIGNLGARGFQGDRSSLFFQVTKRLRQIKEWDPERMPTYLLIENVKNFLSVNRGWDFFAAQVELDEIGYDAEWEVLNSADFGVPQNRERVFIVGHLRGRSTRKVFPLGEGAAVSGESKEKRTLESEFIMGCITKKWGSVHSGGESYIVTEKGLRFFTPLELWRAQGFPDEAFKRASKVNSNTQLYFQAGNSVTVNVIYEIAKKLGGNNK